jgi:hypothetical protein
VGKIRREQRNDDRWHLCNRPPSARVDRHLIVRRGRTPEAIFSQREYQRTRVVHLECTNGVTFVQPDCTNRKVAQAQNWKSQAKFLNVGCALDSLRRQPKSVARQTKTALGVIAGHKLNAVQIARPMARVFLLRLSDVLFARGLY